MQAVAIAPDPCPGTAMTLNDYFLSAIEQKIHRVWLLFNLFANFLKDLLEQFCRARPD